MSDKDKKKIVNKEDFKNKKIKKNTINKNSSNTDKVFNHFQDMKNLYQRIIDVNEFENKFKKEKENLYLITEYSQRIYNFKRKQ